MYVLRHITVPLSAGIAWHIIGQEDNKNDASVCKSRQSAGAERISRQHEAHY